MFKKHGNPLIKGTSRTQFKKGQKPHNYLGIEICTIEGCNNKHASKGWCQIHFMRWYHTGSPLTPIKKMRGLAIERFSFMIEKQNNGCWYWKGKPDQRGYGRFADENGCSDMAHRWAYKHFVGEIPKELVLDHLCNTPKCVNPKHLEPVTHFENIITRGNTNAAYLNSIKTECSKGHPYLPNNFYITRNKYNGSRVCKTCHRENVKRYKAKSR